VPVSDEYLRYLVDQLREAGPVSARKMFGGAGIYYRGRMFGLVSDDTLFLKADESNRADYEAAGMKKFQPWDDKPMTMPYYEVPAEVLEDSSELALWARKSIAAAMTTAKPVRPRRAKRK
jgi:DNA transformation protein and related proteins